MYAKKSLDALTGLRFIAALTVFIHHLGGKFGYEQNRYAIGSAAVTFFFVLSGFILTYVYHDRLNSRSDVQRFFYNRFARIWPLHLVCLIIAVASLHGAWMGLLERDSWPKLVTNLALLQSWVPADDWVFSFNGVSWSISTEAFFYLVFPVFLIAGGRRLGLKFSIAAAVVAASIAVLNQLSREDWFPAVNYYRIGHVNPLVRLPEFCVGIFVGRIFLKRKTDSSRNFGFCWDTIFEAGCLMAIIVACIWTTDNRIQAKISHAAWGSEFLGSWFRVVYPVLFFGISIYVFAISKGLLARIVSTPLFVYLGDISYAFYMIHFIVLRYIAYENVTYGDLLPIQIVGLALLIVVGASILLYEAVEKPAKHWLLRIYAGARKPAIDKPAKKYDSLRLVSKLCLASLLIGISTLVLTVHVPKHERSAEIQAIIDAAEPATCNIDFGSQIRLLGCQVIPKPGKIELRLAWSKHYDFTQRRLVIVLDGQEKQIARGIHNQNAIRKATQGSEFVDVVYVSYEAIRNGNEIAVCFREKNGATLKVSRGLHRQLNKSLVIVNSNKLAKLKKN